MTTTMCGIFMATPSLKNYMIGQAHTWPLWTSMAISFGVLIAMMCNVSLARTFPHNYLLLGLFTLAESVMVGTICMVRSVHLLSRALQSPRARLCAVQMQWNRCWVVQAGQIARFTPCCSAYTNFVANVRLQTWNSQHEVFKS
jgi:hypothetical protein